MTRTPLLIWTIVLAHLGVLACAGAASAAPPSVGVVGPNVLVRPTDAPTTSASARLVAAGGEFESLQVVVRGAADAVSGVRVAVAGQLTGPGGATIPASSVTVYRVGYYDVTGLPSDGDLGGALGRFPDALIPTVDPFWQEARSAFPIDVPAGENRLAWIDVLVPAGQAAGTYSGAEIRVSATDGTQSIPLSVDVVDLDLPSTTSLDGGFDVNPNRLCQAHSCGAFPGGAAGVLAMYEQIALDNRLTLAKPPTPTPSGPTDAAYRAYARPLLLGTAPGQRLRGARLRTVTVYQWATESADEWRRIADADGLLGRVRFHCDEVGTSATMWTACRRDWQRANTLWRGAAVAGAVQDLPLQITAGTPELAWARANGFADLADRVSTLVPVLNRVHPKSNPVFPGFRPDYDGSASGMTAGGVGKSLWAYTSCMSMGCSGDGPDQHAEWGGWPSYGVDQPASQARAMGWMAFEYDVAGEYYYETARDLPTAWTDLWSDDGGNHGDGTLFYPGTVDRVGGTHDVAIESIRLKRIRDGREDHELLLAAARAKGRGPALTVARQAFASAHATDVTQAAIETARASLFGMAAGTAPRATWEAPVAGVTSGGTETSGGGTTGSGSTDTGDRSLRTVTPTPLRRVVPTCQGRPATIVGTSKADRLRGTARADVIVGLGGNDRIVGGRGNDLICAGPGDDLVVTSGDRGGTDRLSCASGRDRVVHDRRDRVLRDCERRTRRP